MDGPTKSSFFNNMSEILQYLDFRTGKLINESGDSFSFHRLSQSEREAIILTRMMSKIQSSSDQFPVNLNSTTSSINTDSKDNNFPNKLNNAKSDISSTSTPIKISYKGISLEILFERLTDLVSEKRKSNQALKITTQNQIQQLYELQTACSSAPLSTSEEASNLNTAIVYNQKYSKLLERIQQTEIELKSLELDNTTMRQILMQPRKVNIEDSNSKSPKRYNIQIPETLTEQQNAINRKNSEVARLRFSNHLLENQIESIERRINSLRMGKNQSYLTLAERALLNQTHKRPANNKALNNGKRNNRNDHRNRSSPISQGNNNKNNQNADVNQPQSNNENENDYPELIEEEEYDEEDEEFNSGNPYENKNESNPNSNEDDTNQFNNTNSNENNNPNSNENNNPNSNLNKNTNPNALSDDNDNNSNQNPILRSNQSNPNSNEDTNQSNSNAAQNNSNSNENKVNSKSNNKLKSNNKINNSDDNSGSDHGTENEFNNPNSNKSIKSNPRNAKVKPNRQSNEDSQNNNNNKPSENDDNNQSNQNNGNNTNNQTNLNNQNQSTSSTDSENGENKPSDDGNKKSTDNDKNKPSINPQKPQNGHSSRSPRHHRRLLPLITANKNENDDHGDDSSSDSEYEFNSYIIGDLLGDKNNNIVKFNRKIANHHQTQYKKPRAPAKILNKHENQSSSKNAPVLTTQQAGQEVVDMIQHFQDMLHKDQD